MSRRQVPRQDGVDLHLPGDETSILFDASGTYKTNVSRGKMQQQKEVEDFGGRRGGGLYRRFQPDNDSCGNNSITCE